MHIVDYLLAPLLYVVVFTLVSRTRLSRAEWVLGVVLLNVVRALILLAVPVGHGTAVSAVVNAAYIAVVAAIAYRRVKILSLSAFYGLVTVLLALLSNMFASFVLRVPMLPIYYHTHGFAIGPHTLLAVAVRFLVVVAAAYYTGRGLER